MRFTEPRLQGAVRYTLSARDLAVTNDGKVWAWGDNTVGQLGNGSNTTSNVPVAVGNLSGVVAIAAGGYRSLAITSDGKVWAWGYNAAGQLGNGTFTSSNVPVQVSNLIGAVAIAAGGNHSLAITSDGNAWAWGGNTDGQLGSGGNTPSNVPVQVSNLSGVVAVAAGQAHSLALTSDGKVWAWGDNSGGQLGTGGSSSKTPVAISTLSGMVAIAAGDYHSLALADDGTVRAWGANGSGQLGGFVAGSAAVSNLTGVAAIAAGGSNSLALKAETAGVAYGPVNDFGELGRGSSNGDLLAPLPVSNLSGLVAVAANAYDSLALTSDGKVWAWGYNTNGQLGNGSNVGSNVPAPVNNLTGVAAIASGGDHSLALTSDGKVWAWGNNTSGQLGNGSNVSSNVPVQVSNLSGVVAISDDLALTGDGKVWAWGYNANGELGNGTNTDSNVPAPVSNLSGVVAISSRLALTGDGKVWAWGNNTNGQLGNGTYTNSSVPVPVSNLSGVVAISGGGIYNLALTSDGKVWAWGDNQYGELGNGSTASNSNVPVAVNNVNGAVAIATGGFYCPDGPSCSQSSLALTSDGKLWVWGKGSPPSPIGVVSGVVAIAHGIHALEITSAGSSVTIDSSLPELSFSVGGAGCQANTNYYTPQNVLLPRGASCQLSFQSPVYYNFTIGPEVAFSAWADGSTSNPRTVVIPATAAHNTANFVNAYYVQTIASPTGGGTVTGGGWYTGSSIVSISASPAVGYVFQNWTGSVNSTVNPLTFLGLGADKSLTANFVPAPAPVQASFLTTDTATQGTWKGVYGADGYLIANDSSSVPTYATVNINGASSWTWLASTTSPRGLQKGLSATDRIASTYYSGSSFSFDINLTGGQHQVALYLLDLDTTSRSETISILDASNNNVLDTRSFANFHNGVYAIWNLTGHVIVKVTNNGGLNAVVSGLFFGPGGTATAPPVVSITSPAAGIITGTVSLVANATSPVGLASVQFQLDGANLGSAISGAGPTFSTTFAAYSLDNATHNLTAIATDTLGQKTTSSPVTVVNTGLPPPKTATFVKFDPVTKGSWKGTYGQDGYMIANDSNSPPTYAASVNVSGASLWTWIPSFTDPRALQKSASTTDRIASTYYSGSSFTFDVNLTDGQAHQVALYCLDLDSTTRAQKISILDASTNAVLDSQNMANFSNGVYAVWSLKGHVLIQVTYTGGLNAVVSGLFFDTPGGTTTTPPTVSINTPTPAQVVSGSVGLSASASSAAGIASAQFQLDGNNLGPAITAGSPYTYQWDSTTAANGSHTLKAIATDNTSQQASASVTFTVNNAASPGTASAVFVTKDTTTRGTWQGVYGGAGEIVAGDSNNMPGYALATFNGSSPYTWALTSDPRALQTAAAANTRIASTFYASSSFSLDLNLTDAKAHQLALYFLDWDGGGRAETVTFLDAGTQQVLNTQSIASFQQGAYLVWNVSGHTKVVFTLTGGLNAVVSGVFLAP